MVPSAAASALRISRGLTLLALLGPLRQASSITSGSIVPTAECKNTGEHFDTALQRCSPCTLLDPRSMPKDGAIAQSLVPCVCNPGLVQCRAGQHCSARPVPCTGAQCELDEAFVGIRTLECRDCPAGPGMANVSAPVQDRTRCLPCHIGAAGDNSTTLGFSPELGDCMCPPGFALEERGADGNYLAAKICVPCAEGMFPGPIGVNTAVVGCRPCPEPGMMFREPATGACKCKTGEAQGAGYVSAGGVCVELSEFDKVNTKFPDTSAAEVTFRDLIAGRESWWAESPFGHYLGIEIKGDNTLEVLSLDSARSSTIQVTSTAVQWLYIRCSVGCIRGNITACHCISNLCVAVLYDDQSTICRFVTRFLYEGKLAVSQQEPGHPQGLPWLFYAPQRPIDTVEDSSLLWKFTFGSTTNSQTASELTLWLAQYTLEGSWLGWKQVTSELELCSTLGGGYSTPQSPGVSWRRFGSSLVTKCTLPLAKLLQCGAQPIFYDMFIQNVDGSLVAVPVRILNVMKGQIRPNRNVENDISDDVFVRRFTLCDAIIGKEGPPEAYFTNVQPRVFRWAAHMVLSAETRPDTDAQINVPILSIAYADAETSKLTPGEVTYVSFRSEYTMDVSSYWVWMTVFIILASLLILALSCHRICFIVEGRHPTVPPEQFGMDPGLFAPKPLIQLLTFFKIAFSVLFWFHFTMTMYWLWLFKLQDTPHTLLPSALHGNQYVAHDVMLVIVTCLVFFCVSLGLFQKLRMVVFLIDWERGAPVPEGEARRSEEEEEQKRAGMFKQDMHPGMGQQYGQQMGQQHGQQHGGYGQQMGQQQMGSQYGQYGQQMGAQQGATMLGAASAAGAMMGQMGSMMGSMMGSGHQGFTQQHGQFQVQGQAGMGGQFGHPGQVAAQTDFPDRGVSAWRSLFIVNELNERLACTRTSSHITWLAMAALLEGFSWKNGARWYPSFSGGDAIEAARYNPILQLALGTLVWLFVVVLQLIARRLGAIVWGNSLLEFVDVCSVANVSVFFLDEPFHGYYIHGKAPTSRGEWCHSELAKALHDEGKGIGFPRGLSGDSHSCQTFEVFLPPDMDVVIPGGTSVKFRQSVNQTFLEVKATQQAIYNRRPQKPEEHDILMMSRCRCQLQVLMDSFIHRVMRDVKDIIQVRDRLQKFWGAPPPGGVTLLQHPVFYEDKEGLAWSSCLAYGSEIWSACFGLPTGFEWHLICFELIVFHLTWRFGDSIFLGVALAYMLNQMVLRFYAMAGRRMLSYTTIINGMFLI